MVKSLKDLNHIKREIPGGGLVYILDTGALINAEADAMLQALHSRSVGGLEHHLDVLEKKGAENFMEQFYVGYGHKSIGDCGSITIFIEGVSMPTAKAVQDNPLYSGQEASTRYIDWSEQPFIDPTGKNQDILEILRGFYLSLLDPLQKDLMKKFPKKKEEKKTDYKKAIKARSFDIARGFLPAGASTNLAWHSNLRQITDHLLFLRHHPLDEVKRVAGTIEDALIEAYPSSFSNKRYVETEAYQNLIAKDYYYHNQDIFNLQIGHENFKDISKFKKIIEDRPPKTELPKYLKHLGRIYVDFNLDYGSFRDVQRHRAINQRMPLLTSKIGFNDWYMRNLPEDIIKDTTEFLRKYSNRVSGLKTSELVKQYFLPMGYNTSNSIVGDLPSMVYMVELRATRFVHPTLSSIAGQIGNYIQENLGVKIHMDKDVNRFDVKRGTHDIVLK